MKIAHVSAVFPPYHSGTGNVCYHNALELARRGHSISVFTASLDGAPENEVIDGVNIHRLRPLVRVGNAALLPGLVRHLHGFDLIHLHYPFFGGEITWLAAKLGHTPLVITYHQDVLLGGLMGVAERFLRQSVSRLVLSSADRLLFTSLDYGRSSYASRMVKDGYPHIDELPNGVDISDFNINNSPADLRFRHKLADGDQVVMLVAGLDHAHYFKGVNILLEALARMPVSVKGVIVGDGDLRSSYQAMAEKLGIASRIHFTGYVANVELPLYYRLADVTVLPSVTMGEAFGLVLVESMACGTPVIATDLPGVRTVVNHGSDGFLVKPGDPGSLVGALQQILKNDRTRKIMGQHGREKVEKRYSWEKIGDRLEMIYGQVLEQKFAQSDHRAQAL